MEDTHISIEDLAKKFGYDAVCDEAISFYGVCHLTDFVNCLLS